MVAALVLGQGPAAAQPAQPQRIVAVGDLHGDYSAWLDIARAAGLIGAGGRWAGGKTVLVQLGDITDRGPASRDIIRSLQQLQKEAPRAGGRVVVVLGNHEAMNLVGDLRYVTAGEYAAFADAQSPKRRERAYDANQVAITATYHAQNPNLTPDQIRRAWIAKTPLGWVEHRLAWSPSGPLGKWAGRNPAVVKIGGTLFAHGGISAEYARLSLDEINRRARTAMESADDAPTSILNDPLGPLWYRGLVAPDAEAQALRTGAAGPPLSADQELEQVLAAYGARRLVIGHTPSLAGIAITGGGRLARVDTGISLYYGGPLSWLEILGDRLVPRTVARSTR